MAKPKQALLDLQKKYGVKPERDEKEEEQAAQPVSPFQQTQVKSSPKSALDDLKKKYAENPRAWNENNVATKNTVTSVGRMEDLQAKLEEAKRKEASVNAAYTDAVNNYRKTKDVGAVKSLSGEKLSAMEARKAIERQIEQIEYVDKYKGKTYEDTLVGQFGANRTLGRISQDTAAAYNEYLNNPTDANRTYAEALNLLEQQFQEQNAAALDDENAKATWITKTAAQYLPQWWDQTKATVTGAAGGAGVGAGVGSVIPGAGTVAGAIWGARAGAIAGSGMQSYNQMQGAAFRELLAAGMDEDTARAAANDEAVISAMIEMGDTALDVFTLGTGTLLKTLGKGGVKAVAGEAAETGAKKLIKALGKYGLNIGSEMLEEASQQAVSIANRERWNEAVQPALAEVFNGGEYDPNLIEQPDTGVWDLLKRTGSTALDAATGKDYNAGVEIWEAAKEGGKIAAMFGGVQRVGDLAVETGIRSRIGKKYADMGDNAIPALIETGLESEPGTESRKIAEKLQEKQKAGKDISSREVGSLVQAIESENGAQNDTSITPTETPQETLENLARETVTQQENAQQAQPVQRESTPYNVMAEDNPVRQQRIAEVKNLERKLGYGEEGMKAFNSVLESGNQSIEQVRTNFQSAYEAGMTNLPREKAKLIDSIQETAYNAGRMDAIKSMQKAETKGATVWGKEGGLIQNEYSSKLDATTADTLQMIGKATGTKIIMKDQVFGGLANGSYKDGVVTIASDAQNPYIVVAKHEVTHRMQDLAPKQYTAYRDYAVQIMAGSGNKTTLVEQYQARAARDNVYLTAELAMDEIAADFTERILTDEKALNDFVNHASKNNDTRTMGQKFFQAVREFINKVKRIFKGDRKKMDQAAREQYGTTIEQLEKAEALWKEAYRAAEENVASGTVTALKDDVFYTDQNYSLKITDKKLIEFLENQEYIVTYKAMQQVGENKDLHPPMAAKVKGSDGKYAWGAPSEIGAWQQATEDPSHITKFKEKNGETVGYYTLNKGNGKNVSDVAYAPYEHSSNYVINDQFDEAYQRDNLVVVECHIPVSEMGGTYKAQYAHNATGIHNWKKGDVGNALAKHGKVRKVYLTRYLKPVRVLSDAEVAQKYKEILGDVAVPFNVVTPNLLAELEKIGVTIDYKGSKMYQGRERVAAEKAAGKPAKKKKGADTVAQFSLKDDPMKMEQDLDSLRQQREELQDEIDVAYLDDLPQADINKLENRMVKLNAEIDKLVAQERKATVKTSMNDILSNLSRYRRSDLESLAEQISDGNWDGYEDLSRSELEDALREEIEAMELSPLEMQSTKMGLYVRPASKDTGTQFSLKAGDEGTTYEEDGKKYSLKSLRHDIAENKMFDDLVAAKVFTTKEAGLLKENLEKLISYMLPNASILDMNEAYTKDNRPFSSYKPNSDPLYKISLDFSTLCRKRLMTQYVIEQLQLRENRPMSAEEQIAIRSMLLDYRRQEKALQVACAMCYVEAARLKAPKQMEAFFDNTADIMRKYFAKKDKAFDAKVKEAQAKFKVEHGYEADAAKKDMNGKDSRALNEMSAKMRKGYTPNAEQQTIIDKAVSLPRSTFLTAANLTALSIDHPEIYDAYTSHIRASTRSKSLEGDVPYYYGDSVGQVSDSFIEGVNAENGMRFDSWSDFQMKHMLDMITAVIDLSVRKSKMHGYTKFPEMVRIFGKTGMMFNLSGVTEGNGFDADGNLVFSDTESIDINEAIKLRKMFPETAGLQCIGVSDDHIRALLRSEHIDYVIPYHTSGMNATLRKMAGIYAWKDYTKVQHATKDPKAKKPANADDKWQVEPVWSEFYVGEGKDGYDIMQKTAQRYIDMCHERGLIPKFNDFTNEDGYWKLLVDRKMINQETGQIIEQQPVKPIFDFDLIQQEIDREVSQYDPALEEKALKYVVDNFDAVHQRIKDLKKGHPKKSMLKMGNQILQAYAQGTDSTTQHSLKGQDDLLKQNAKLKEVNQELRNQFKTTKFAKVDKKSLNRFAKQLLKDYSSGADIDSTREALDDLYTYMANGEDGGVPSWDEAYMRAYNAAVNILSESNVLDDELFQEYKALRDELKTTGITIDKQYDHDLIGYEIINEFRKANFGRIKLVNDGLPVDVFYEELAYAYPDFFDPDVYMNQADQLSHIEEVLNSLQPTEVNPYSHNMREAATWMANDIMERFFELPQAKPTFADKAERKLTKQKIKDAEKLERLRAQKNQRIAELIVESRTRLAVAVSDERMAADNAISELKKKYAEKQAKASETKKARELRARIIRHTQEMSQTLLRPSDKRHIPHELRAPVAELLDAINLESQYTIDPATGKRQKNVPGDPTKRTLAFTQLRSTYQKIVQEDGADIVVDPAIEAMLDRVIEMRDVKLADMTSSQLADIWQVVRVMEHTINTAGKLLSYSKYERTMEWADAMVEDTETRRSKRGTTAEAIRIDMENPYTFFNHYGDAGKDVFRMLRDAQDKQQLMVNNVQEKVQAIVDPKTVRKLEEEVHQFTTERGVKLTLTKAQIMDIYLLTKRVQAQEHLLQGGIVQPEVESKKIKRGTDAILLTVNDLTSITNKLTVKEREIAIKMQMLTRTTLADYGNAASMKAYGYKKFTGEDYWPIKSAREGIHSNVEKGGNNTRSIKNIGLAKTVMPHASNPLDVGGIFKTFSSHAADMIDYAAWLCPMEDANRLYNFQFRDEGGNRTGKTIKGLLDRVGGKGAQQYWHRLMEDIQNGIKSQADNTLIQPINKAIGNVRGASVGANIRVIIQQPTAIFRAAAVLSPESMFRGMVGGGGWKTALKHSPIAMRKDMGGFDISSPMQMNEILFDSKTGLQRFNEAMMAGAGKADAVTWGRIWNACEAEVKWNRDDLQYRSNEFYEAVNELFTEVIDQSQVVDGVLQRSQLMRSNNALLNQATAFMGEPTMTMNMMLRAWDGLRNETDKGKRGKAIKTFGRTAMVLLVTNAVNALAQSLIDAARDDEDEEYWKKFYNALYGVTGEEETLWEKATGAVLSGNLGSGMNPVGYIPFAKDALSILQGYNVTRADADVMGDIIDAAKTFIESVGGDGKKTIAYATKNLAQQVGKVFGISAANILRDVWGITRTIALETGNIPLQYEMEKAIYKIDNEKNISHFADILYKAYQTDKGVYQHIYDDMEASGFNMDKLQSQMESRMKKDQGVNKVSELEQRYLHPDQQSEYDSKMKDIQGSTLWKNANEKQKDDLEATLYDLVTGNTEGLELKAEIAAGKSYGLDETEYLLYELALDMADTPNANGKLGGTPTAAEKAAAIASMDLGNGEIAYLWDTDQALEAFAYGIDMEKYAQFKGAVGNFSGDTKQKQIDQYLRQMGVSTKEYLYLMGTVYSSYKKRKDYISYFGKQD